MLQKVIHTAAFQTLTSLPISNGNMLQNVILHYFQFFMYNNASYVCAVRMLYVPTTLSQHTHTTRKHTHTEQLVILKLTVAVN